MSKLFVSVLLPTSLVADAPNLQQKTMKVGIVGRSLAIFRVDKAVLYNDDDPRVKNQIVEAEAVATLLRYIETPQYLRRLLFPRERNLEFAGILPPLRTPHHPLRDERANPGDYREAAVIKVDKLGSLLEMGLREKGVTSERLKVGQRLTVKLGDRLSKDQMAVTRVARGEVEEYWGYEVSLAKSLADALNSLKADYTIGTSRYGKNLYEALRGIEDSNPRSIAVAFGGPYQGLFETCKRQDVDANKLFDVVINAIPQQGTETVRTEEALIATLALLNALVWGK